MTTLRWFSALLFVSLGIFPLGGEEKPSENDPSPLAGKILVISVTGDVLSEGRSGREFERLLDDAIAAKVPAIIFEIDTTESGDLGTQKRLLDSISRVTVPSFSYIPSTATGPGALIALATDGIYLGPNGIIGGAGIREVESEEGKKDENSVRDLSILKARARSLAGSHGHRPEVAEAFIDSAVELKIGEEIISKEGEVLTLTANEAVRVFGGKPFLARGIVESVEELLRSEGLVDEFLRLSPRSYGEMANRARLDRSAGESVSGDKKEKEGEDDALFRKRDEGSYAGKIIVLNVGEDTLATGKASFDFMDRTLKKAELDGAEAVIFDMDTPGGFAWYTEGLVLNSLQNISYPTYTFVNSRAESAGAIIAMGTDHIYMRPAATIGSALVVSGAGQDLAEAMEDKVTQMIIGTVRNVAELKGHNPDIAEAFVTREKEVRVDGVLVHESGSVLNLNTIRAIEEIGGRPLLAKGVARDMEDLIAQEGLKGDLVEATPLGLEAFAHWVQKLSFLLIIVGVAGAYLELNSPGFGFPGLVSVASFGLFFFGNYLAGNLVGYELVVLLVFGLILIAIEVFIFPGTIIPGFLGAAMVMTALGMAMVDRVDFEWKWSGLPGAISWSGLFKSSLISLAAGMAGALGLIILGMRLLPGTKMGHKFILAQAVPSGASLSDTAGIDGGDRGAGLVGLIGEAATDLRPSGKGAFEDRLLDVISDGEFIERGSSLRVVSHEGSRILVARL